ncbi:MAG TPA: ABC transporter permease [Acidimicrobiia bacterium]
MSRLQEFAGTQDLAINLTLRELRGRYKKSVLGWTWSLLNPLATVAIYSLVFSFFLKIEPPVGHPSGLHSFALFLLCALVPWNLFQNGLNMGLGSIVGNGNLIKKVYFPRELLVASGTASLVVTMLIELGVLCAILLVAGNMVLPWIPLLFVLIAIEAVFVFGCALVLSVCNVYFRDVQYLVAIALQVIFYTVPIVYPIRYVPVHATVFGVEIPLLRLYSLNPLVRFVSAFRDVLYNLRFPPLWDTVYITLWAIGALVVGLWVFSKLDRRLAEEV